MCPTFEAAFHMPRARMNNQCDGLKRYATRNARGSGLYARWAKFDLRRKMATAVVRPLRRDAKRRAERSRRGRSLDRHTETARRDGGHCSAFFFFGRPCVRTAVRMPDTAPHCAAGVARYQQRREGGAHKAAR